MSSPVTNTDMVFLKRFAMLIGFLALLSLLLVALAYLIHYRNPPEVNPRLDASVAHRTAPLGGVHAGDTGRAALVAAQEAAAAAAASQVAYGGTTDGSEIYDQLCQSCHSTGAGGSPVLDDKAAWGPRIAQGEETLLRHAIDGFTGEHGFMPPRGGNPALTDEQVKAAVDWMMAQVR